MSDIEIRVDTQEEKEQVIELLVEIAERPQLYDTEAKEDLIDAEVNVRE